MQFKISGQKTDAMSAGREKIDDGEKEFGGWAGNVFLIEKMARELFAVAFWQPTGRHATITLRCLCCMQPCSNYSTVPKLRRV